MSIKISKQKIKVIPKDGKHYLFMPNGEKIPLVVWTRVWDGTEEDEHPYVIAKIYCDIGSDNLNITGLIKGRDTSLALKRKGIVEDRLPPSKE